jgi:hypothetical protein
MARIWIAMGMAWGVSIDECVCAGVSRRGVFSHCKTEWQKGNSRAKPWLLFRGAVLQSQCDTSRASGGIMKKMTWLFCLFMSGCSIYSVSTDSANKGIPILVKKPVLYQETKIGQTHWHVKFEMKEGGKTYTSPKVPIDIVASWDAYGALETIRLNIENDKNISPDNFDQEVFSHLRSYVSVFSGCGTGPEASAPPCVKAGEYAIVMENKAVVVSELSRQQYYINTKRPWIGSASAAIKLAQDGTMTDAQSEVEDKTVETMLSVVPVASYLTKQWSLGGQDKSESGSAFAAAQVRGFSALVAEGLRNANLARMAKPKNNIRVLVEETIDTYILRKEMMESSCPDGGVCVEGPRNMGSLGRALEYPQCESNSCVELLGVIRGGIKKDEEEKEQKGWTISGSVVPPEKD